MKVEKRIECDVLVVGAGPSGSSAAIFTARNRVSTILIDKKEEIGKNVPCAEGVGRGYLKKLFFLKRTSLKYKKLLPLIISRKSIVWRIDGISYHCLDVSVKHTSSFFKGFATERKIFDKWLAEKAVRSGARLLKSHELVDLDLDDEGNVRKAIVRDSKSKKVVEVFPKIIIAADGCESTVLKLLELFKPKEGDIGKVWAFEMTNLKIYEPRIQKIYLGDFAPSGWGFVFPKSKYTATLGIGLIFPKSDQFLERKYEEFLELEPLKRMTKDAKIVVNKRAPIRHGNIVDRWVIKNVILTGDCANHNIKPYYEGVLPGVITGKIAGELAIKKLKGKPISHRDYIDQVRRRIPYFAVSELLVDIMPDVFKIKEIERKYLLMANALVFFALIDKVGVKEAVRKMHRLLLMSTGELKQLFLNSPKLF